MASGALIFVIRRLMRGRGKERAPRLERELRQRGPSCIGSAARLGQRTHPCLAGEAGCMQKWNLDRADPAQYGITIDLVTADDSKYSSCRQRIES